MTESTVFIGCAAGFADERPDAAGPIVETLAQRDGPRYLMFETLGERTLALAQLQRRENPDAGYTPQTEAFLRPILARCREARVRIVANFGAANPLGAGNRIVALARELGLDGLRVAVVLGDDLLTYVPETTIRSWPVIEGIPLGDEPVLAANAYLGARPIAQSLGLGADVVILGRGADSALALGPLVHEFGWPEDDWDRLAAGTLAGHLLECSTQVTGGYFADPGFKDVPGLGEIGYPIAEVAADGAMVITKAEGTGGLVSERTVKEQLLYELHDPSAYLVPDVTLDVTAVEVEAEAGPNRVRVTGARGRERPPTLKVTVSAEHGYLAEGEMTYSGMGALARAELAAEVLRDRLRITGLDACRVRIDLIGTLSTFDSDSGAQRAAGAGRFAPDGDYRVRLAGQAPDRATAQALANEVIGLYSSGPGGGGGARRAVTPRIRTSSALVPRDLVRTDIRMLQA